MKLRSILFLTCLAAACGKESQKLGNPGLDASPFGPDGPSAATDAATLSDGKGGSSPTGGTGGVLGTGGTGGAPVDAGTTGARDGGGGPGGVTGSGGLVVSGGMAGAGGVAGAGGIPGTGGVVGSGGGAGTTGVAGKGGTAGTGAGASAGASGVAGSGGAAGAGGNFGSSSKQDGGVPDAPARDSGSPDAPLVCAAGAVMRCTCWDGSSSTKTCLDDGSAFAACVCPAQCGNGVVETGEECDDGNTVKTDSCISCKQAKCGDGFVWSGHEACDDGNTVDTDACPSTCKSARCGDGFVWAGHEACDDGNTTPNDACENNCTKTPTVCGNGIKEPGEQCDDGNLDNTDSCTEHCEPPKCGDGFVQAALGEDCDDGNTTVSDGCNNDCLSSGKVLWSRTFAGAAGGHDVANGVAVDKDGNVVVVGGTTVTNLDMEMLIWKLAPNGDEIVSRTVAGIGDHPDMAQNVAINSLNQMAIVGTTYSESTPNVGTRIWYGLFTPTANAVWTDKSSELGNGYGVAVDAQDNMYFAGSYYTSTTVTYDAWVRRINSLDRSVAWTGTFDYGSNSSCAKPSEDPRSIALKSGGTVLLAGHYSCGGASGSLWAFSMETGAFLRNTDDCRPTWVINDFTGRQVDEDGIHIAKNGDVYIAGSIGGGGEIWRYAPDLCGTGNCHSPYCAGPSASISAGTSKLLAISGDGTSSLVAAGDYGYVVKMNLAGSTLWKHTLENVNLKGIALDPTGYIYVVGTTTPTGPTAPGDAFVAKLTP